MPNRLRMMAIIAALAAAPLSMALAQTCAPGYVLQNGVCYVAPGPGGVVGGAANAAGAIVGGAVNTAGAIAGGAVNAAGEIAGGAVGAVTGQPPVAPAPAPAYGSSTLPPVPAPACAAGYVYYSGACYPAR